MDYGTGIYNGGTFNMYGGSVKDNPINPNNENTASFGGGVYNSSTFNMYGGSISGNHAQNGGGGVCNRYSGIFNFQEEKYAITEAAVPVAVYLMKKVIVLLI